jgi:hypothetical protein
MMIIQEIDSKNNGQAAVLGELEKAAAVLFSSFVVVVLIISLEAAT